jgi:hypothetical protein
MFKSQYNCTLISLEARMTCSTIILDRLLLNPGVVR